VLPAKRRTLEQDTLEPAASAEPDAPLFALEVALAKILRLAASAKLACAENRAYVRCDILPLA
jgi:hypothetical protein